MINFLRSLLPQNTPPHLQKKDDLLILRERIFQGVMLIAAVAIIIAFVILVSQSIATQAWTQLLLFTGFSILILAFAVIRRVPFVIRAVIVVIMLLASGAITYVASSTINNAKIYLITASVLASVFLGLVPGLLSLITGLGIALIFTIGKIDNWLGEATVLTVIGALLAVSSGLLLNFLQSSLKKQRELAQDLEYERLNLELKVEQNIGALEKRVGQIRTAAEIGRSISSTLDPQALLQQVVDLIRERFDLYYVGLFLLDESKKFAVLRAGTGQPGKDMIAEKYRLPISETSMIGWSIIYQKARISQDVGQETVRFKNPFLPLTRSEMALPFISRGNSLGAVSIQSVLPNAFDENDILILQSIVDSLSVAFENARLFQQSRQDLEEIRALNREYLQKSWSEVGELYGDIEYSYQNPSQSSLISFNTEGSEKGGNGSRSGLTHTVDLPITLRDEVIGQISIEGDSQDYTQAQREFIEAIALQTALALDNARLIEKTQRSAIQEQALSEISAQLSQALSVEEILRTAVKEIGRLPAVNEVSIHLAPPSTNQVPGTTGSTTTPPNAPEAMIPEEG